MGFLTFDVIMMSRTFLFFSILCSAVLLIAAKSAVARTPGDTPVTVRSDFDLSRQNGHQGNERRYRIGDTDTQRFRSDKLGPKWSYSPIDGGPTLELAALGAGRKGAPKLAHVGVDWSF